MAVSLAKLCPPVGAGKKGCLLTCIFDILMRFCWFYQTDRLSRRTENHSVCGVARYKTALRGPAPEEHIMDTFQEKKMVKSSSEDTKRTYLTHALLLLIIILATLPCRDLRAGAYEWGGLGSRAQSMGGAFVGLSDDWTAIYWNPAGLTQLEGSGMGFAMASPHPVITDKNSMSNLTAGTGDTRYQRDTFVAYDATEPTQYTNNTTKYDFYVPDGLAGYWKYKGWSMGAGFYVPVGYHADWKDTLTYGAGNSLMISAELFQELAIRVFNFSLARPINDRLSFGAGLNLLYGSVDYEANKRGIATLAGPYSWSMESENEGIGYEGVFGLLYKATDKLSLGAVYRSGGTVNMEGDAESSLTFGALNEVSAFRQKFIHPQTLGLGLAYKAKPDLTLTADYNRTFWSSYRVDVNYKVEGTLLTDNDYSGDWNDSDRYRCGFEYKPYDKWAFRAGYMFDKSPLRDKSVSLSHIVGLDRHNVTIGVGHQLKDNLGVDFIYAYAWGDRSINGVHYRQRVNYFGLSLNCRF